MQPQSVLHFWFEELTEKQHFIKDTALDATMRERCELFVQYALASI